MIVCLNRKCGQPLREDFCFCPKCGADNRPTGVRGTPIATICPHNFEGILEFCTMCGANVNPSDIRAAWTGDAAMRKKGLTFIAVAVPFFVFAILAESIIRGQYGDLQPVVDFAENAVQTGRIEKVAARPFNWYSPIFALIGTGLGGYGAYLFFQARQDYLDE